MIDAMEKPTRAATGRDSDKYIVRFPDGLRDRIAAAAKENNRSMNAEIIGRIEDSFSSKTKIDDLVAALQNILPSLERQEKQISAQLKLIKTLANFMGSIIAVAAPKTPEDQELMKYGERVATLIGSDDMLEGVRSALELMTGSDSPFARIMLAKQERLDKAMKEIEAMEAHEAMSVSDTPPHANLPAPKRPPRTTAPTAPAQTQRRLKLGRTKKQP